MIAEPICKKKHIMDDSDQDFVDLCSKLLKRVRRKAGDTGVQRKADLKSSTQACGGDSSKRSKKDVDSVSKSGGVVSATQSVSSSSGAAGDHRALSIKECDPVFNGSIGHDSGDVAGPSGSADSGVLEVNDNVERGLGAKDKVLLRMQQFKRVSPPKLMFNERNTQTGTENNSVPPRPPRQDSPEPSTSGVHHAEPQDSDEVLAVRLQQELDREAAVGQAVDLADGGLFLCQLCHRNLSHMTTEGRAQHLNRCLDEIEGRAPAPPPPPSVPDCPICGKRFKSLKRRSAHLKRCSSDMGVSPADLLQALQRQATEAQSDSAVNQTAQTGGAKRKGPSDPGLPVRKKPRRKAQPLDEDTMVALALSSSLLQHEKQREMEMERELQREAAAPHTSMTPLLKWRSNAGKTRSKRKKGGIPRPPPLLLVQDAEMALRRLQERVASLLLHRRAPSPPTPTRCPSSLPAWSGAAPLWQKSALRDGGPSCLSEFYTPELREFIVPLESTRTNSETKDKPDKSIHPAVREGTPLSVARRSILPSTSPAPSTPGTGQLPVGSQTLNDLMELADEGMTLTQWGYGTAGQTKELHLSGFVPEEPERQADLCLSGFIPDTAHNHGQARRSGQPRADTQMGTHRSVVLSRLVSDLSSMVNNPQLSDIQLQVDSGEVFFAHSFMLYARCPLLAQMVHDSGFGVQEEDMPAAQRVLLGEVPGQAVHVLLQYLYTAHCPVTLSLLPHVLELASRFDLEELQQLCQLHSGQTEIQGEGAREGESWEDCLGQEQPSGAEEAQRDQAFLELLRSMWNEEEDDDDGRGTDGGGDREIGLGEGGGAEDVTLGDREIRDEQVNEEEMEEIYEFAATQRKREEEKDSLEEDESEEGDLNVEVEEDQDVMKPNAAEPKGVSTGSKENSPHLSSQHTADPSLDRSYSRLFSDPWGVYEEDPSSPPSASHPAKTQASHSQQHGSPRKPSSRRDTGERPSDGHCLQSSASDVIDLSISPPSSVSSLPIPGLSPGAVSGKGDGGHEGIEKDHACLDVPKEFSKKQIFCREERLSPKRESQGPRSICVPLSPASSQCSKQPELIVLSDSSEEMELAAATVSSSPPSPNPNQNLQNYTRIKTRPNPEPNDPSLETSSSECGASTPVPASSTNQPGSSLDDLDQSPMDCSPEVSWLIPTTPVQPSKNTSTSSTQTHSSICRMQLFPKAGSSSSSSVPPPSSLKDRPQTSSNPHRVSTHIAQTEYTVSRAKLNRGDSHSSSLNISHSPKRYNSSGMKDREVGSSDRSPVFAVTPSQAEQLPLIPPQDASTKETPLHSHPQPYSSTPLHTDAPMPPALPAASPLLRDPDGEGIRVQGRWPEKIGLGALHLSLSDPSDSKSPTPHRGSSSPHRDSRSLSQSRLSSESNYRKSPGRKLTERAGVEARGVRNEEGEGVVDVEEKGTGSEGGQEEAMSSVKEENEEAEVSGSSFCQSFTVMDEPPLAFDDSWGLDAGADGEGNGGVCFSLRLEDSGGASPPECGLGGTFSPPPPLSSAATHTPLKTHNCGGFTQSKSKTQATRPSSSLSPTPKTHTHVGPSLSPSPPHPTTYASHSTPEVIASLLDPNIWDDWAEEEEEALPLSQRVNPVVPTQRVPQFKTPVSSRSKECGPLVPITPMPSYSDMDTPELKNKLNRFGVRPLPKRQMILKLREIHHYTHQLSSSGSEDEAGTQGHIAQMDPLPTAAPSSRPVSCALAVKFKQPRIPSTVSPVKHAEEDSEPPSASQGSNTSSTAASEDSERSNPEICLSSDGESDSDGGVTASQASSCHKERLHAVRSFILSDPELYSQILRYQPLVLSHLQARLKAAGIRLGAAKLLDYLDSQCITFTTAKPGHSANNRRRGRGRGAGKGATAPGGGRVRGRKRAAATAMD